MLAARSLRPERTWLLRGAAVAAVAVALLIDRGAAVIVPLVFVLVVPFEKLFPRHQGQPIRRPHLALDIRYALTSPLLNIAGLVVAIAVGIASLAWVPGLVVRPVVAQLPSWATIVIAIAAFDMLGYWAHRWMHEVPQLWRFHAVHHSTEHLDWVSGFRLHPLDGFVVAPPVFFLFGAGVEPAVIGALTIVQIAAGLFLHANVRWRLQPLHRVIATPEFHHWHHANETDARCTNYSALFPIWDQVFGSYWMPRNKRPARYGVDESVPMTMRGQLLFPFDVSTGLGRPSLRSQLWRALRQLVRHPVRSARRVVRAGRGLAREIWRSTRRPRRRLPKAGDPYDWATKPPAPSDRLL